MPAFTVYDETLFEAQSIPIEGDRLLEMDRFNDQTLLSDVVPVIYGAPFSRVIAIPAGNTTPRIPPSWVG